MKDLRTTLTGLIGGVAMIALTFGFDVSQEIQTSLVAVVLFFIGLFAKDGK